MGRDGDDIVVPVPLDDLPPHLRDAIAKLRSLIEARAAQYLQSATRSTQDLDHEIAHARRALWRAMFPGRPFL